MNELIISIVDYNTKGIKKIREEVFVKEQNVPESLEWDGLDSEAKHILVKRGKNKN